MRKHRENLNSNVFWGERYSRLDNELKRKVANFDAVSLEKITAHGGEGSIGFARLFDSSGFKTNCDFIDVAVVYPGTSIGLHTHSDSEEIYVVLSGEGRMEVNGREFSVRAGDIVVNPLGGTHGLVNNGDRDIRLLSISISADKLSAKS